MKNKDLTHKEMHKMKMKQMNKEINKQFFLIRDGLFNVELDFGIIHLSDKAFATKMEKQVWVNGDCYSFVKKELNRKHEESLTHIKCSEHNADRLFFLGAAIANEVGSDSNMIKYLTDIYEKYRNMNKDNKRTILEKISSISKNLN